MFSLSLQDHAWLRLAVTGMLARNVGAKIRRLDQSVAELTLFERQKNSTPRLSDPVLTETLAFNADVREALLQGEQLAREEKLS